MTSLAKKPTQSAPQPKPGRQAKADYKAARRAKLRRRRTLTFIRMCRYGVNNFSRNAWLTIAATAVMSVTLLIIFMTFAARQVLLSTVDGISKQTEISIYLGGKTDQQTIDKLTERLKKIDDVDSIRYVSAEQARQEQARQYRDDPEALEAIKEASNEMSATLHIAVKNLSNHSKLDAFLKQDDLYNKHKDPRKQPSTSGTRRQAISTIGGWVRLASIGGSVATIVFVVISSLVVFNTIRMAIFNRKDEIRMMKLIGAEKGFIRGPFVVEAVMYGFIAAIIASIVGYSAIIWAEGPLMKYGVPMRDLLSFLTTYAGLVLLTMILLGAAIGVISSIVATRKYLKL